MSEVVVVTSGKGGVGKTTTSASFACGLARRGRKTALIDFDNGLRNLDLVMGCEHAVVNDFMSVASGYCTLKQALIKSGHVDNLSILVGSQTKSLEDLTLEGVAKVVDELRGEFEFIICDSPAGIGRGAFYALHFADRAVIVVNPDVSSARCADRILSMLSDKSRRAEHGEAPIKNHLLATRYSPERVKTGEMMSAAALEQALGIKLIGVIPEAPEVLAAANAGIPMILNDRSVAGLAYADAVCRLLGEVTPMRFVDPVPSGIVGRLASGIAAFFGGP